jgi:hypothetical protein
VLEVDIENTCLRPHRLRHHAVKSAIQQIQDHQFSPSPGWQLLRPREAGEQGYSQVFWKPTTLT